MSGIPVLWKRLEPFQRRVHYLVNLLRKLMEFPAPLCISFGQNSWTLHDPLHWQELFASWQTQAGRERRRGPLPVGKSPFAKLAKALCQLAKAARGAFASWQRGAKAGREAFARWQMPLCQLAKALGQLRKADEEAFASWQTPLCQLAKAGKGDFASWQRPLCQLAKAGSEAFASWQRPLCQLAKASHLPVGKRLFANWENLFASWQSPFASWQKPVCLLANQSWQSPSASVGKRALYQLAKASLPVGKMPLCRLAQAHLPVPVGKSSLPFGRPLCQLANALCLLASPFASWQQPVCKWHKLFARWQSPFASWQSSFAKGSFPVGDGDDDEGDADELVGDTTTRAIMAMLAHGWDGANSGEKGKGGERIEREPPSGKQIQIQPKTIVLPHTDASTINTSGNIV